MARNHGLDEAAHDTAAKHTIIARSSKNVRAPSLEYVRMKNPPEPDSNAAKKKTFGKDKEIDKVKLINIANRKKIWNSQKIKQNYFRFPPIAYKDQNRRRKTKV